MLGFPGEFAPPAERDQSPLSRDALPVLRGNVLCTISWLSPGGKANLMDLLRQPVSWPAARYDGLNSAGAVHPSRIMICSAPLYRGIILCQLSKTTQCTY